MSEEREYLLGTHDEEIARLGVQHRVWRPRTLDAWRRAGFTVGQRILDVGCGPGYASFDLAEIVGPAGRVIALDRSRRFLNALDAARERRGLGDIIETHELDLDEAPLPAADADGAWSRWVFAFVTRPRDLLERVCRALRPGGVVVMQEYFHYATWQLTPRLPELDDLIRAVTESWRDSGGEPDIGLALPRWLEELGFEVRELRPIIDIVPPSNFVWQWPGSFIPNGVQRMVALGRLTPERGDEILAAFRARESDPHTLMITPAVLEVIAVRR